MYVAFVIDVCANPMPPSRVARQKVEVAERVALADIVSGTALKHADCRGGVKAMQKKRAPAFQPLVTRVHVAQ